MVLSGDPSGQHIHFRQLHTSSLMISSKHFHLVFVFYLDSILCPSLLPLLSFS